MGLEEIKERLAGFVLADIKAIEGEADPGRGCLDDETLIALVENSLGGREREEAEAHIASCPRCRRRAADLTKLVRFPALPQIWLAAAAMILVLFGTYFVFTVADNLPWKRPGNAALLTLEDMSRATRKPPVPESDEGPGIVFVSPPEGESFAGPVVVDIVFEPGPAGLKPDMDTLRVSYHGADITKRFTAHMRGDEIRIERATFPVGTHVLVFAIKDGGGNETVREVLFEVK